MPVDRLFGWSLFSEVSSDWDVKQVVQSMKLLEGMEILTSEPPRVLPTGLRKRW